MICERCGKDNPDQATRCVNCQALLEPLKSTPGATAQGISSLSLDNLISSSAVVARRMVDPTPPPPATQLPPVDPKAWKMGQPEEFKPKIVAEPSPPQSLRIPETEELPPLGGVKPGFFNYRRPDTKLLVVTPLATLRQRVGAAIYDHIFLATVIGYTGVIVVLGVIAANFSRMVVWHEITLLELANSMVRPCVVGFWFLFTALSFIYHLFTTALTGKTWGKQRRFIRVTQADGRPPNSGRALLRTFYGLSINLGFCAAVWFVRPEFALVGLLFIPGILATFFDKDQRGIHDRLAGTYVVSTKELVETVDF
jgi:uncharacterized RDD family membrane protein YckC